jgi:hypothetical protein
MKKLIAIALALTTLNCSFGGQGKGIVPVTISAKGTATPPAYDYWSTSVWVTNITSHTINVTVTFYGKDGTAMPSSFYNYTNFITSNTQLAPNTTGLIYFTPPTTTAQNYGKAVITWTNVSGDDDTVGVIAHAHLNRLACWGSNTTYGESFSPVMINNGMPF